MNVDRAVLAFAGGLLLLSLALAWFFSAYWLLLTAFVGLNMLQSAFTGFCPAAIAFRKLGLKEARHLSSPLRMPSVCRYYRYAPQQIRVSTSGKGQKRT